MSSEKVKLILILRNVFLNAHIFHVHEIYD